METIKSYTDISQSKTLSKILPLETADMGYLWNGTSFCEYPVNKQTIFKRVENIPCWSLAAMLSVLPTIDDGFEPQLHRSLDKYRCTYEGEEDSSGLWRVADNPVDACYEIILKLHELNLL